MGLSINYVAGVSSTLTWTLSDLNVLSFKDKKFYAYLQRSPNLRNGPPPQTGSTTRKAPVPETGWSTIATWYRDTTTELGAQEYVDTNLPDPCYSYRLLAYFQEKGSLYTEYLFNIVSAVKTYAMTATRSGNVTTITATDPPNNALYTNFSLNHRVSSSDPWTPKSTLSAAQRSWLVSTEETLPRSYQLIGNLNNLLTTQHNTATVEPTTATISTAVSPSIGGGTTGAGTVTLGASVTVTASANPGYNFVNWTENGSEVSSSASYTFTANSNRNLVANFVVATPTAVPGSCTFQRMYGGTTSNGSTITNHNCTDSAGNVIIVGSMYYTVNFGDGPLTTFAAQDGFIAKYTAGGTCLWSKHIGNVSSDQLYAVAVDSLDNIWVTGVVTGGISPGTYDFGFGNQASAGGSEVIVVKFSPTGTVLFKNIFGGTGSDQGRGIAVDAANSVYITGTHGFFGTGANFGGGALTTYSQHDVFLTKLDSSGTHLWSISMGGTDTDLATKIALDSAGNPVVCGQFLSSTFNYNGGTVSKVGPGRYNAFVGKWSASTGANIFFKQIGNTIATDVTATGLAIASDGSIFVSGDTTNGTVNFGNGQTITGELGGSSYVVKLNSAGVAQAVASFGAPDNGPHSAALALDASGNPLLVGEMITGINFGTGWLLGQGGNDAMLVKFNASNLSVAWAVRGAPYGDRALAVCRQASTGKLIVSGDCGFNPVDFKATTVQKQSGTINNGWWAAFVA